ncbi:MAG: TIGR01777 family oxidoreductase [Microcystaceae cyanobacterium]
MKIAITGATGFIGTQLVKKLNQAGDSLVILTRTPTKAQRIFPKSQYPNLEIVSYDALGNNLDWQSALSNCEGVVNLAGEPIAERWTTTYKKAILNTRQQGTQKIVEAIKKADPKPSVLVNASAIGYYGTSETQTFDESSPAGRDFLAKVCQAWEAEAQKVTEVGVRLVILRLGIVLGDGGALAKMLPPFKLFAGGPIGDGRQWFSWIHQTDVVNLIIAALKQPEMEGVYNATAPNPVRMNQFCSELGGILNRPSWLPVPGVALELLLGEGSKVVLEGQEVLPKATQSIGFNYQFPTLKKALQDIVT